MKESRDPINKSPHKYYKNYKSKQIQRMWDQYCKFSGEGKVDWTGKLLSLKL